MARNPACRGYFYTNYTNYLLNMETLEATIVMQLDPTRINTELEKANVTEAILRRLRENAAPLLGKPITNKAEYELVHAAERACAKVRTTAIAICKRERDPAIAYQKAVITREKEVVAEIEAIEAPLKKMKADFNGIMERRMQEDAMRQAAKIKARKDRLFAIGFRFDGEKYDLPGFTSLTEEDVSGAGVDDLQLGEWLNSIEREVNEHREREAEKERTAKIAADALAKQQREEAERQAAVAAEQERRAKELADKEAAMNARILNARRAELRAVGCVSLTAPSDAEVLEMDDAAFAETLAYEKAITEANIKAQREADAKAAAERKANEERIAAEAVKRAEAERIAAEARAKEEEEERAAKMSDAAKFRAYHAALMAVKVPEMKSKAGQKKIADVLAQLGSMLKA